MPFSEPQTLIVEVMQSDIAASTVTTGNLQANTMGNSLVQALKRLDEAKALPGQDEAVITPQTCLFYAETSLRVTGTTLVSTCDCYVCTTVYSTDNNASLLIAAENVFGIKPSAPYTVTLTKL